MGATNPVWRITRRGLLQCGLSGFGKCRADRKRACCRVRSKFRECAESLPNLVQSRWLAKLFSKGILSLAKQSTLSARRLCASMTVALRFEIWECVCTERLR